MKLCLVMFLVGTVLAAPSEKSTEDFEFIEDVPQSPSTGAQTPSMRANPSQGTKIWLRDPNNALCGLLRCGKREVCLLQDRYTAVCVDKQEVARSGDRVIPMHSSQSQTTKHEENDDKAYINDGSDDEYEYDEEEDIEDDDDSDDEEEEYDEDDYEEDESMEDDMMSASASTMEPFSPKLDRQPFASKHCGDCPLTRPVFLCGSDNHTYSSECRLQVHNCLHEVKVQVVCKGFCPCKAAVSSHRSSHSKIHLGGKSHQQVPTDHNNELGQKRKMKGGSKKYNKYSNGKKEKRNRSNSDKRGSSGNNVWGPTECSQEALAAMGNRMLDWFAVIMSDKSTNSNTITTKMPSRCKKEVTWMFGHLDANGSGRLETKELYQLQHDDKERCIRPFLDRCDIDRDGVLSGKEWCKCFDESERPCAALRTASQGLLGSYIPECDSEGWYRPTQCHVNLCWCVDRHGVELPNTRSRNKTHCESVDLSPMIKTTAQKSLFDSSKDSKSLGDGEHFDDEDEEVTMMEGSADMPLDI